jgi:hypothetical protein
MQVLDLVDKPPATTRQSNRTGSPSCSSGWTTMPQLEAIGSIVGASTRQAPRIGRDRSLSSAASRSTSTKFAKAQSVNRRARMNPTFNCAIRNLRRQHTAEMTH